MIVETQHLATREILMILSNQTPMPSLTRMLLSCMLLGAVSRAAEKVDFNRDVRPILSDTCFNCHGPDAGSRKADLRLDLESAAKAELPHSPGKRAVVPGKPLDSELIVRILTSDPDEVMPPPKFNKPLTTAQKEVLQRWIAQGAEWRQHWAYEAPVRPPVPPAAAGANPIDAFINARLAREKIEPNPRASKRAELRRVTYALSGLPPTPEELAAYEKDESPEAYQQVVDRLLSSPRHGEHMARYWLDAARYADTHGLHLDNHREIWAFRDWVINAFNHNMPYDRFTIEQLAGDLLENPTLDQRVATGFIRSHPTTSEGGSIDAEVLVRYGIDRVEAFSTIWMGSTLACASCHDHKYDPFSAKDFFSLYAFFNSTAEPIMDQNRKDTPPVIKVPRPEQVARSRELMTRISELEASLLGPDPALDALQKEWELTLARGHQVEWTPARVDKAESSGGATLSIAQGGAIQATGTNPLKDVYTLEFPVDLAVKSIRLEVLPSEGEVKRIGRAENGNFVVSEVTAEWLPAQGEPRPLKFGAASADYSQAQFPVSDAIDGSLDDARGWGGAGHELAGTRDAVFALAEPLPEASGRLRLRIHQVSRFSAHALARFRLHTSATVERQAIALGTWWQVPGIKIGKVANPRMHDFGPDKGFDPAAKYANGLGWTVADKFVDGVAFNTGSEVEVSYFHREITADRDLSLPVYFGSDDQLRVLLNGEVVWDVPASRSVVPDSDPVVLHLRKGVNRLLCKVVNTGGVGGFYFRADTAGAFERAPELLVDDLAPEGVLSAGWNFVKPPQPVHSGQASRVQAGQGTVQHYVEKIANPIRIGPGDSFYAWVYLDPAKPPSSIMLQWHTSEWAHRAFWGADTIPYDKDKGDGPRYRRIGPLPAAGGWVRLDVSPQIIGIAPGQAVTGVAFTQQDGQVWWDDYGVLREDTEVRLRRIALLPPASRSPEQQRDLMSGFRRGAVPDYSALEDELRASRAELAREEATYATTLVAAELPNRRKAHRLVRGMYDQPAEEVQPETPAILPPMSERDPRNRLGLARWTMDPANPLTARVTVNRFWQQFFGTGIVKTSEDFGSQGEPPVHPELLDWLAVEFRESGWDVRKLVRMIVTSETFRRSSRLTPALRERDPDNRLLARGARTRLDAEVIRDTALAASGLLVEKIGGPPAKPYQPPGVWEAVAYADANQTSNTAVYTPDTGEGLYRRSLYNFWKRTAPPPSLAVFDAPNREFCVVRRERTNTPLAALTLMNDVQYVEAARVMAENALKVKGDDAARATWMFERCTSRPPAADELKALLEYLAGERDHFARNAEAAAKLLSAGAAKRDPALDPAEHAAWTMLGNLLLNLDETISNG